MESDIERCLDSGADHVVLKPLDLDALEKVLDQWMPRKMADVTGSETGAQAGENASVEAIDLSMLRRSVGDKFEVQSRLLKTYIDALPKTLFDIRQAYAWHNLEQIEGYAHKLKSSSSSLGATRIAQLCTTLELACREGQESVIATSLAQLQQAAESVVVFVEAFGNEKDSSGRARNTNPG
jgi:HPt (histidine-containing phosphotransfer) domain-containing protein